MINMKKTILTFLVVILLSSYSFSQWINQISNTTTDLNSVYFLNKDTGFVVGKSSVILKTIDGGNNWILHTSVPVVNLNSVYFPTKNTGYIGGEYGKLFKTTDSGNNWSIIHSGTNTDIYYSINFINKDTGYIAAGIYEAGNILKTTDGGNNWTSYPCSVNYSSVKFLHFQKGNKGIALGESINSGYFIMKTTNSGANWDFLNLGTTHYYSGFINTDTSIYLVGEIYTIKKSTNWGNTWIYQDNNSQEVLHSVYFSSIDTGYVCGENGTIMKTTNGGNNWKIQNSTIVQKLNSIFFINSNIGIAVGDSGKIIKTNNGGSSSIIENKIENKIENEEIVIYPNPFSNLITIKGDKNARIIIYSIDGKIIDEFTIKEFKVTQNLSYLNSGIYYLIYCSKDKTIVKKIFKE
jgi:photosystem II stability/assembly factor-like uncharacterized protein